MKRRAKTLRITEAEVVRAALDAALAPETASSTPAMPGQAEALRAALAALERIAASRTGIQRSRRDDLYEEREQRWVRGRR